MNSDNKNGWKIYADNGLIGTAYYRYSDQPWFVCDFDPTPQFAIFKSLFDKYAHLVNEPRESDMDFSEFYEVNIESLNLRLMPFGNVWQGQVYVAQIYDGVEAWLRPL